MSRIRFIFIVILVVVVALWALAQPAGLTYESWIAGYPSLVGTAAGAGADPDGDGIVNLMEYALAAGDPTIPDVTILPRLYWARRTGHLIGQWDYVEAKSGQHPPGSGLGGVYHISLRYRPRAGVSDLRYIPQITFDLRRWFDGANAIMEHHDGADRYATSIAKANAMNRVFMRLKVVK